MQRYHDTKSDPLPQRSTIQDAERARIEQATEAFLAGGGQIEQVGFQMTDKYSFVISASRSPVYAHLFQAPKAVPEPVEVPAEPVPVVELVQVPAVAVEMQQEVPVALIRGWAVLNKTPKDMAHRLGMSEKQLRQICRDNGISIQRQR